MSKRIVCPRCEGEGTIRGKIDWLIAAFTFGLSALVDVSDRECCRLCEGKGYWDE